MMGFLHGAYRRRWSARISNGGKPNHYIYIRDGKIRVVPSARRGHPGILFDSDAAAASFTALAILGSQVFGVSFSSSCDFPDEDGKPHFERGHFEEMIADELEKLQITAGLNTGNRNAYLCPECASGSALCVQARVPVRLTPAGNVLAESPQDKSGWDECDGAECRNCGWQGSVGQLACSMSNELVERVEELEDKDLVASERVEDLWQRLKWLWEAGRTK
jgi:hypothetical protein